MKTIILILLLLSGCSSSKVQPVSQSQNQYGKPYAIKELKAELNEITEDSNALVMIPLKEYVYELGFNSTGTFLFNNKGQRNDFKIYYADYPTPLMGRMNYIKHPRIIKGETLDHFLNKLDDIHKDYLANSEYEYVLFFVWNMSNFNQTESKKRKIHAALVEDVKQLNEDRKFMQLVHLYVGNYESYQLSQEDFRTQKIAYAKYMVDTGQVDL